MDVMKKHFKYLKHLFRHKYFVFVAGLKVGAPVWRLIIHDWTKFLPSEYFPYVNFFYGHKISEDDEQRMIRLMGYCPKHKTEKYIEEQFDRAWLLHQNRNKHHWQYWVLTEDSGKSIPLSIPSKYAKEMVADWAGAGRTITGKWDIKEWYQENRHKMNIHAETKTEIEELISEL